MQNLRFQMTIYTTVWTPHKLMQILTNIHMQQSIFSNSFIQKRLFLCTRVYSAQHIVLVLYTLH